MKNKIAIKITLSYLALSCFGILLSNYTKHFADVPGSFASKIQPYNIWILIGITATLMFVLIRKEIKQKEELELRLTKAKLKAEEADSLKSAFLSNISHEIRTPLNSMLGFSELLLDNSFSAEDKQIFANNLTRNGNELLKLINDIMDISKIQEHQYDISKKKFNLNNLLNDLYNEYQQSDLRLARHRVDLYVTYGKNNLDINLFTDPIRLKHVFRNLLNNALYFTNEGFINFGFEDTKTGIVLFVEDTGCGIDEQSKKLIFKPFYKAKNLSAGSKGFGLGLAISKGLIELLGSNLQFISEKNRGTRFYFEIDNKDIVSKKPTFLKFEKTNIKMGAFNNELLGNKLLQN